ncbi:MAG: response regulator [Bacteroidetes bacterium]|nr:response regulator [Bacteroidota bacterium]
MNIIIYEDRQNQRQSLELWINNHPQFSVVGAFPNCKNVEAEMHGLKPEIVLMDIDMPEVGGIEGVIRIKELNPDIKILMFTAFEDDDKLFPALEAGADGYLLKTDIDSLFPALKDVHAGGAAMSPGIAKKVLDSFRQQKTSDKKYELTKREREILELLTKGYTYKEISSTCYISMDTVSTHLRHIYAKLHVNCGTAAVAKAIKERII